MKNLRITALVLCLLALLSLSLNAQTAGPISDAPQHVFAIGGGCDGNLQCSADAGYAEKITGGTYSYSSIEFVPSFVVAPSGLSTISVKAVPSTGVEQIVFQSGRWSAALGATGGAALPSANQPTFNFATTEHATLAWRLNKTLNTMPGTSNNYIAITPYFTQIAGVANGNTIAVRLHWLHGMNGQ